MRLTFLDKNATGIAIIVLAVLCVNMIGLGYYTGRQDGIKEICNDVTWISDKCDQERARLLGYENRD